MIGLTLEYLISSRLQSGASVSTGLEECNLADRWACVDGSAARANDPNQRKVLWECGSREGSEVSIREL